MKCEQCGFEGDTETNGIVYSGVDAFILGVMDKVERICYSCANEHALAERAKQ